MDRLPFSRTFFIGFLASTVFPAMAQSVDFWKTEEYYRSGGLDLINAAEAYAQGFTGKGVRIGIVDTGVDQEVSELAGKVDVIPVLRQGYGEPPYYDDYSVGRHGTHVAGIAAAKRDGQGMHGVAFESDLSSITYRSELSDDSVVVNENRRRLRAMLSDPTMKVVNNSWQFEVNIPRDAKTDDYYGYFADRDPENPLWILAVFDELVRAARKNDKVIVFAAANEGSLSSTHNLLSYFDPSIQNWLSVTAVNPAGATKNAAGEVVLVRDGLPYYTNRAGIETAIYTLAAPGSNITGPDSDESNGLISLSGTSMAAPHVSGAVAVVAEAFPWMTGKQLADTVLTTTDKIILPDFAVQRETTMMGNAIKIILDSDKNIDLRETLTKKNIRRVVKAQLPGKANRAMRQLILGEIDKLFTEKGDDPNAWGDTIIRTTSEEVFGQGMLNLGHAVKGIGKIDVNRLSAANVRECELTNGSTVTGAVETFDTKGFAAVFSNDIDERRWDNKYHHPEYQTTGTTGKNADALALAGLGAGLEKTGDGLLVLSGTNSYTGPTIVSGGRLSVSKREDGTGGVLTASNVFVNADGMLQGNGTIRQAVHNNGIVAPGNSIGTLTVGDYHASETGVLQMEFAADGSHDKLIVTGSAALAGELQLVPHSGFYSGGTVETLTLVEGSTTGNFDSWTVDSRSPVLNFQATVTNGSVELRTDRDRDAYRRYADNGSAARAADALLTLSQNARGASADFIAGLDFSNPNGGELRRALRTMTPEVFDMSTMAEWDGLRAMNRATLTRHLRHENVRSAGWTFNLLGDVERRHGHNGFTGWRSETTGLEGSRTEVLGDGLTMTADATLLKRKAEMSDGLTGKVETTGAYAGLSLAWQPTDWRGLTLFGAARMGVTDNELSRTLELPGEKMKLESEWTGTSASLLAGLDWHWETDAWRFGPVLWTETVSAHRQGVKEKTSHVAGLNLDGQTFTATTLNAGFHAGGFAERGKARFASDFRLTRRETVSDNAVESRVKFIGTDTGFNSATDHAARDAWVIEAGASVMTPTWFVDLKGRAEVAETGGADSSVNLKIGRYF